MTTNTQTYKLFLKKLAGKKSVKAKFYNNGQGQFAITYRNKMLGWANTAVIKALLKKQLVKIDGLFI